MEKTIKETTRLLLQGTLTKEEADKILLDLYNVSGSLLCSCENQKLGQKFCDKSCVDSGEFD